MAIQRHPSTPAKQRTIAALIARKNIAEAVSDAAATAEYQAEIERVAAN
tara:strand:- start:38 stop:184 length:147 start_codon:yes stop_codon:yes gene_type:complete